MTTLYPNLCYKGTALYMGQHITKYYLVMLEAYILAWAFMFIVSYRCVNCDSNALAFVTRHLIG